MEVVRRMWTKPTGTNSRDRIGSAVVLSMLVALVITALGATSASAETCKGKEVNYNGTCETEKEHAEFQAFAHCPFAAEELTVEGESYSPIACDWAGSSYKERWESKHQKEGWEAENKRTAPGLRSEFKAGNVIIPLKLPIQLQGGGAQAANEELHEGEYHWLGPEDGVPAIQPVPQTGPALTKDVDTSKLSESELARYNYEVHYAKDTKTYVTVELAGPANGISFNILNLFEGHGTAFHFPVKVKLSNPFIGSDCYVGSDAHPIVVDFTTGKAGELEGKLGTVTTDKAAWILTIWGNTLVSDSIEAPGVEDCGVNGGADEALDSALGLPSTSGNFAILNGVLRQTGMEVAKLGIEGQL